MLLCSWFVACPTPGRTLESVSSCTHRALALLLFCILFPGIAEAQKPRNNQVEADCDDFDSCAKLFERNQNNFEIARRLYETGASLPAKRVDRRMRTLRERLPNAHYLLIIEAYLHWGTRPEKALHWCRQARALFQREGNLTGETLAVLNLGTLQAELGHYRAARQLHEDLEALGKAATSSYAKAVALTGVAHYRMERHVRLGETFEALNRLPELETLPANLRTMVLLARAAVAGMIGEFSSAEADYLAVLELAGRRQDAYRQAACSHGLAFLYQDWIRGGAEPKTRKRIEAKIESLLRASIATADRLKRVALGGHSRFSLAQHLFREEKDTVTALALLEECLASTKQGRYRAVFGRCAIAKSEVIAQENPLGALELARDGFAILGSSNLHQERLISWQQIMRLSWALLEPDDAYLISDAALSVVEMLRGDQVGERARMRVFSPLTAQYQEVARSIVLQRASIGHAEYKALEVLERARARTLVEAVREGPLPSPYDEDKATGEAYDELSQAMRELLEVAVRRQKPAAEESKGRLSGLGIEWTAKTAELGRAVKGYQEALGLARSRRLPAIGELQALLDEEEALVTYILGHGDGSAQDSFAFVLSREESKIIPLEHLDAGELIALTKTYRGRLLSPDGQDQHLQKRLRSLLLKPVLGKLRSQIKKLIVIPDGPLFLMPFRALDAEHAYSVAPSIQYWSLLRSRRAAIPEQARGVALVDPHVSGSEHSVRASSSTRVARSWRNMEADVRLPLPQTRREGAAILDELGDGVRVLGGDEATRANFLSLWKPKSNFLHVATHALVDTRDPRKSALVLATPAFEGSETRNLSSGEIENLEVDSALVVLSGCSTAGGKSMSGEGVLSIARAFQRGGAIAVVASLWPVYDKETADFFERFYAHLASGLSVGEAVYLSQRDFDRAGSPLSSYSAFVVLGDASMRFQETKDWERWWLLSFLPLPVALTALRKRRRSKRDKIC